MKKLYVIFFILLTTVTAVLATDEQQSINLIKNERNCFMENIIKIYKKIETSVIDSYKTVENAFVTGYKTIEDGFVKSYKKIEKAFTDNFFSYDTQVEIQTDKNEENY